MTENPSFWGGITNRHEQPRDAEVPERAYPPHSLSWRRRGLIVWDSTDQQIAHLFATYVLEILEYMRTDTQWREYRFVIGTPVIEIDLRDPDARGVDTLADRMTLAPV